MTFATWGFNDWRMGLIATILSVALLSLKFRSLSKRKDCDFEATVQKGMVRFAIWAGLAACFGIGVFFLTWAGIPEVFVPGLMIACGIAAVGFIAFFSV